ncbi:unnamed protein product [Gulo gulo]|uniref:Uncharacterized protein n=1 Tax=Gulo gulo TaxID=48420 RepID=A0A9X9MA14_GULGU|nr:unnamed protein product [Gulo gulo]
MWPFPSAPCLGILRTSCAVLCHATDDCRGSTSLSTMLDILKEEGGGPGRGRPESGAVPLASTKTGSRPPLAPDVGPATRNIGCPAITPGKTARGKYTVIENTSPAVTRSVSQNLTPTWHL